MALRPPTRTSAALAALALLRSSGARLPWPAPGMLALTPYVVPLAWGECWRSVRAGRRGSAWLSAAAGLALGAAVLRRATGAPGVAPAGSVVLRIISANVYEGRGSVAALAGLIADETPDVLLLQEADAHYRGRLVDAGVAEHLPYAVDANEMALWSRWELEQPVARALEHRAAAAARRTPWLGTGVAAGRRHHRR